MNDTKAVLVTGAGKRLGRALALKFAREGYDLALHYHQSQSGVEAVAEEITALGQRAVILQADLQDLDAGKRVVDEAYAALPHLTGLVNSASVFERDNLSTMNVEFFREQMRVNAETPLIISQAFWRLVDGPGWILNMIDCKIFQLTPDYFSYTLSKMALENVTRMLAMGCAPKLRVNGIAPGVVLRSGPQTEEAFQAMHNRTPVGKGPTVDEICDVAVMLSNAPSTSGQIVAVDGGRHFYSPALMKDF